MKMSALMKAGLCYDHVQSRMCVAEATAYANIGNHEIAEYYWKLAKHHARCAVATYHERKFAAEPEL